MNTKQTNRPYTQGVAITPSDTVAIATGAPRAIYVGVSGDITCLLGGVAVLFKAVPVGILPISPTRVNATATTATTMLALY